MAERRTPPATTHMPILQQISWTSILESRFPCLLEDLAARKGEELAQRFRSGRLAAHRLQTRARGTDLRIIEINIFAFVPCLKTERERVSPTFFAVFNDMRRQFFSDLFFDERQFADILAFHRKATQNRASRSYA